MSYMDDTLKTIEVERDRMPHADDVLKKIAKERDGPFCDLTLVSGQTRLKAHKIIVCTQSRVIWTACTGQYKEASGVFEVKEWSPELVERMVDYMYTGNYEEWPADANEQGDIGNNGEPCFAHPLILHATMASLADMYMISGLQKLAENRFVCAAKQITDVRRFLHSVPAIYALEADSCKEFRKVLILWLRYLATRTTNEDDIMKLLEDAMSNVPEFAVDFAMSVYREPLLGRCSACGDNEIVPVEPLQCRCQRCNRGGASTLQQRFKHEQRNGWV